MQFEQFLNRKKNSMSQQTGSDFWRMWLNVSQWDRQ